MSKAFTREEDGKEEQEEDLPDLTLPKDSKNYITPKGADRLKSELKELLDVERPKVVKTVSWAASNGDRSENADYIYGKRRLREIDKRIRFLTKRLDAAEIIDPNQQKGQTVLFGATVTIEDENERLKTYSIVGIDETDPKKGHISWISPIGRALLKHKIGDTVTIRLPKGDEDFVLRGVEYKPIE